VQHRRARDASALPCGSGPSRMPSQSEDELAERRIPARRGWLGSRWRTPPARGARR
jgi:hypothetical protein